MAARLASSLALAALVASSCTCGQAPEKAPELALSPLPEPPKLDIPPEELPGGGKLAVVAARPQGEVRGNFHPVITFSRPMVTLEAATAQKAPPATVEPPIAGEWRWLGSASVELVPTAPIPLSTRYRVTVPAGLTSLDGGKLEQPYTFEFETPRLTVQDVTPSDGFRWLGPRSEFTILLDQRPRDVAQIHLEAGAKKRVIALRVVKEEAAENAGRPADFVSRQVKYTLAPLEALPPDSAVELVIPSELASTEGPLTSGPERRYGYRTHGPLRLTKVSACLYEWEGGSCPWGPLVLFATNPVDPGLLKGKVTITPAVEIDWDRVEAGGPTPYDPGRDPHVSLPGRFRPGTTYTVKVDAGVTDELGQRAPAFEGTATTDHLEPSFDAGADVALLESGGDGALPVQAVNLSSVRARIWELTPSQMARVTDTRHSPPGTPVQVSLDTSSAHDDPQYFPLDVRGEALRGRRSGLFLAEVHSPELAHREDRIFGQLTDLAVHAKLGATSGVVWVTSLASGKPVAGASLALWDREGRERWSGVTDGEGLARLPGLAEVIPGDRERWDWATPFALVSAEKEGEVGVTLSTWQGGLSAGAFDLPTEWDGQRARSLGVVFAERGIYRPGDEVLFKGIARYRTLGEIRAPAPGTKVTVKVTSARGDDVWSGEATTTAFGTFSARFTVGKDAPLGTWSVNATMSAAGQELEYGGWFRVEEYRAPQFQVDVSAKAKDLLAGDPLRASVLARYLFGGAMAGARVRWSAARTTTFFQPPGNEGFTFGPGVWSWDDEVPTEARDVAGGGDGFTDAAGAFAVDAGKAEAPSGRTHAYTLEAEVEDVSRQRVAGRVEITVHPASVYAGLRLPGETFATAGKPARLELVAVTPQGARQGGVKLGAEVRRREWKSIRKRGVGGEWYTVSEPTEERVAGCEVTSAASSVPCEFTPAEPGFHVIEVTAVDAAGRKQVTSGSLYVIGSGWVSWQRNDTDRLDLVADRKVYDVGQTAKILVKSPYPEADAVVTVEREGVRSARLVHFQGSASTIDVPLGEEDVPNVFVSVVMVRGRVEAAQGLESGDDPGRPAVRVGYVQLRVEKKSKRLAVEVKPDGAEKRPRDRVTVELQVRDAAGQGARAELAVWAVDEAVLRLTGYEAPDPVDAVHPERGLSVRVGEPLIHLVLRRLYRGKGETAGGGGGGDAGGGFRNDFRTTVLFLPEVVTDAAGRARVELTLPDNLTTFRIMAVAVTEGDRFGSGEAKVTVSKPLLALPALPRLLRVGDRAEAGVVVHGRGFAGGTVKVSATAEGLKLDGAAERTVTVAEGKPVEVRFPMLAERAGTATLRFSVEGGGERDGLEQKLPVILPVSLEAVAAYGDTDGQRTEGLVPPAGVRPGVGGLTVTLASTVLGGFDEGMRQLVDYPYGCVEQLSSRLVPFVALRELSGKFGVAMPGKPVDERERFIRELIGQDTLAAAGSPDPDAVVAATVSRIQQLQRWDGGFGYWPGSSCASYDGSSYAVLALARAKEVGYAVDGGALEKGKRWLADVVASGKGQTCWGAVSAPAADQRVFALWTLARAGDPRPSYYGQLHEKRAELPLYAQAMLADALFVGKGDRNQARRVLTEVMNHAVETPGGVHFEESGERTYAPAWSSDTRTTGIVLMTLTNITPDHPYVAKMGRYLGEVRKGTGRFRTTQEAAFSLMALAEVTRTKERTPPDFTARVQLGQASLADAEFRGRSMNVVTARVPPEKLGSGQVPLVFARDGQQGTLYYGALLRYAPVEMPLTPLDRGIAVQRWFEPYAGGGQARAFYAGELIKVRVRVASSRQRAYVSVDVPLPAGLEAVDTSLATAAQVPPSGEEYGYENADEVQPPEEEASPWSLAFWSPFNHTERRDDRVVLFADHLPAGVHTATVVARATTPGDFVLKPAQAEEMYAPEVFGRSDGGRLQVVLPAQVAER